MNFLLERIEHKLKEREDKGALRKLPESLHLIDFSSNDYLGLAHSKELHQAILNELATKNGRINGATGSRLLTGNSYYAVALEQKLADIFQVEATLLLNSGYTANMALLSSLPQKGDTVLYDELSHASLKDGIRLSLATKFSFRHNDMENLEVKLKKAEGQVFIVIESIYSMDGDRAPICALVDLAQKYNAALIVDEAHSTGIHGAEGSGLCVEEGVQEAVFARIHTFGKAMGVHGACVAGKESLINYLVNFARPFIYTTAMPLHSLISISCAFDYLNRNSILQADLQKLIQYFNEKKADFSGNWTASESPIQGLIVGDNHKTKGVAAFLHKAGFDARPILSPTVKEGTERIRVCLHQYNTKEEVDLFFSALEKAL